MGPPVARSTANPWAPGLANSERSSPAGVEPTTARVWPKLVSCKIQALASAAKPDGAGAPTGRRARVGGGLVVGFRN